MVLVSFGVLLMGANHDKHGTGGRSKAVVCVADAAIAALGLSGFACQMLASIRFDVAGVPVAISSRPRTSSTQPRLRSTQGRMA